MGIVKGRLELSSFSKAYAANVGIKRVKGLVHVFKMSFMVISIEARGVHKKRVLCVRS